MSKRKKSARGRIVRVAIVGMGIGKANARPLHANPRAEIAALCDLDPARMKALADELGTTAKHYTDYKKMCRDPEIDAVFVGTPNRWHVPVALEAVRQGKHVLVTKPLADGLAPARKLVRAAGQAGVVNMMSLSIRNSPGVRLLGHHAHKGAFGDIYYARARSVRRSGIPDWSLGFIEKGGGAFRDMGVHVLDSAWWLMGRPRPARVLGVAGAKFGPRGEGYTQFHKPPKSFYRRYDSDDYGGGLIRFRNGAGLQIESFWASHQEPELNIELFGTRAGARLKPLTIYRTVNNAPANETLDLSREPGGFHVLTKHWVECILDGKPCEAPLRDGLAVQEMMEALLDSARLGREVKL